MRCRGTIHIQTKNKKPTEGKKALANRFRDFFVALVCDEPIFQLAHQKICDDLQTLTASKWMQDETIRCKVSEYSPVISNMLEAALLHGVSLGSEFFNFLNYLGSFSKKLYTQRKEDRRDQPQAQEPTEQQQGISDNYSVSGQWYPARLVRTLQRMAVYHQKQGTPCF